MQNFLARNMRQLEMITLYLAFIINMILLFHRVNVLENVADTGSEEVANGAEESGETSWLEILHQRSTQ